MKDSNQFHYSPSVWIVPLLLLIPIWFVYFVDTKYHLHLSQFGIYPRNISGFTGVVFSPFLHGSLGHLANNSVSIFVLTSALVYFYRDLSLKILVYGTILSGLITWLIARESYHIGASGLVYVLFSFIFFKGIMTKYYRLVALSLTVISFYGGMFWYIFPNEETTLNNISWEAHLAGLLVGLFFAIHYKTPDYHKNLLYDWQQPDYNPKGDKFLERFDENGNFVNKPVEEIEELTEENSEIKYFYTFKEKNIE